MMNIQGDENTANIETEPTDSRKRTDQEKSDSDNSKKQRKVKMTISKLMVTMIFYLLLTKEIQCQKIIYSEKSITIQSVRKISDLGETLKIITDIKKELKTDFKDALVIQKGESCMDIFNYRMQTLHTDNKNMLKRRKRGISLLGELLSSITDVPSPSSWKGQLKVTHDLIELTNNEGKMLKHIKGTILNEGKDIIKLQSELKKIDLQQRNETNELKAYENILDESLIMDTLCNKGFLLLLKSEIENRIKNDIIMNSYENLPSKYMFPTEKIKDFIYKQAALEKLHSPIFYSENEIRQLYSFESTLTVFSPKNNSFISLLNLPLADYSHEMTTLPIPNLNNTDKDRLYFFEKLANKNIDRLMCSKHQKAARLLDTSDLKRCQKHRSKEYYICNERIILSKFNTFEGCNYINTLPIALAIEISPNTILIDSPHDVLAISCPRFNTVDNVTKIDIPKHPIKLTIPSNCSVTSKHLSISKLSRTENEKIRFREPKEVEFSHLTHRQHPIHTFFGKLNINETSIDYDTEILNEMSNEIDLESGVLESESTFDSTDHLYLSTTALTIAIFILIVWCLRKGYQMFQNRKSNAKSNNTHVMILEKNENDVSQIRKEVENTKDILIDLGKIINTALQKEQLKKDKDIYELFQNINERISKSYSPTDS